MSPPTNGTLHRIVASKRDEVARMRAGSPPGAARSPRPGLLEVLRRRGQSPLSLITEIKLRSPSAGALSTSLAPASRALCYARAGATMISVLTDGPFFGGSFGDLANCRDTLDTEIGPARPFLLCKEFVLDPIQLDYAAFAGADAVLLIARILDPESLARLAHEALARGLEPLVEVYTEDELAAASTAGARFIGVNARDLDTLRMDTDRAARILAKIDPSVVTAHLSGLKTVEDVAQVARGRADAALIGEALMRCDDPTPLLQALVRAGSVE